MQAFLLVLVCDCGFQHYIRVQCQSQYDVLLR